MVEEKTELELFYLVYLKKRTQSVKEKQKFFVCVQKRRDEFNLVSALHCIGYWHEGKLNIFNNTRSKDIEEVWIPWNQIEYVKSLMYKPR